MEILKYFNEFVNENNDDLATSSVTELLELEPTVDINSLSRNVEKILFQYSGRSMAAIQVENYLREFNDLGKEYLANHNIKSRDEFESFLSKLQSKIRQGKGKERGNIIKQVKQQKSDAILSDIERMALEAGAEMDRQIAESE